MEIGACKSCGETGLGKAGQDEESFSCVECSSSTPKKQRLTKERKTPEQAMQKLFPDTEEHSPEGVKKDEKGKKRKKKKANKSQGQSTTEACSEPADGPEPKEIGIAVNARQEAGKHAGAMQAIENDLTCAVCIDLVAKPVTLADCGHTFCFLCLRSTVKQAHDSSAVPRCPTCRSIVKHPPTASNCMIEQVVRAVVEAKPEPRRSECRERLSTLEHEVEAVYQACSGWPWNCLTQLEPMWDEEDTVFRCPECAWEIDEEGSCTNQTCSTRFGPASVRIDIPLHPQPPTGGHHGVHSVASSDEEDEEEEGLNEFDLQDDFINDESELSVEEDELDAIDEGESDEAGGEAGRRRRRRSELRGGERMAVSCAREQRQQEAESASEQGEHGSDESDDSREGADGRQMLLNRRKKLAEKKEKRERRMKKGKRKSVPESDDEEGEEAVQQKPPKRKRSKKRKRTALDSETKEKEGEEDETEEVLQRRTQKRQRAAMLLEDSEQEEEQEKVEEKREKKKGEKKKKKKAVIEDSCRQRQDGVSSSPQRKIESESVDEEDAADEVMRDSSPATGAFSPARASSEEEEEEEPEEEEEESDGEPCVVCGSSRQPSQTMLCDGCDAPHHARCVGLRAIPTGAWFCNKCAAQ